MIEEQPTVAVTTDALVAKARDLFDQGYRLVQIGATALAESLELNYSFDKGYQFLNLRLVLPPGGVGVEIPSVSGVYWCALIYENELHDLFGLNIKGIVLDYGGNFYKLAKKFPFIDAPPPAAAPLGAAAPAPGAPGKED